MATAERLSVVVLADWVAGPQQGQWTYNDIYISLGVFSGPTTLPSQVLADLPVEVEQFFV